MISPETLTRHELVGLPVRVVDARSDDLVGISGRVVSESANTVTVRTPSGDKRVPKLGTTFEFAIGEAPSVTVETPSNTETGSAGADGGADADADAETESEAPTDEAAECRKASGSTSELGSDTAGVRPRQSGPSADGVDDAAAASRPCGECKDVVYVTVDGARLLSRPAERTERGVSTWR